MRVITRIIGATYNWYKEGRKENFWKRVFLKKSETMEEMNDDYYAGLRIV